ncbi:hypothetical protein K0A97_00475 [Patescibacteria group bacterium]|nr:hypothetical protein [Patescibacteria group bacterium]
MNKKNFKLKNFLIELKEHIPFTILATLTGIIITIFCLYWSKKEISGGLFESIHFLHVIMSAIVTSGIYYKYKKNPLTSILIGTFGAIFMGSLSDILLPWVGGNMIGLQINFHLPLLEMPFIILGISLLGGFIGMKTRITKIPHFIHVFLSVFASLFYILAFSNSFNIAYFIGGFFIVFLSVIIPCCISDILLPFVFIKEKSKKIKK